MSEIQTPVKPKTSNGKGKGKQVALPTLEEERVSQDNLELLTNNEDRLSRGNGQQRAVTLKTSETELDDPDALHLMAHEVNQSRLVKEVAQKVKGGQMKKSSQSRKAVAMTLQPSEDKATGYND
jgi:hypothetical protein